MGPFQSELEYCNKKLKDEFGNKFDRPQYRIVWSTGITEKRESYYDDKGRALINPEVRELPKYDQWNKDRYILERVAEVPPNSDLTHALSYEPLFTFENANKEMLPPKWEVCLIVINAVHENMNQTYGTKYKVSQEDILRMDAAELARINEMLFGNETSTTDALAYGDGVSLSGSYKETVN